MNKNLFKTKKVAPRVDMVNKAGGVAYSSSAEHDLCVYSVTGCLNGTYYAGAEEQLDKVKELAGKVNSETLAKVAVYSHETGRMKDIPSFLLALLGARGELELVRKIFPRVITNVKMLCNFVQVIRSGVTGRKSFGTALKRLIQNWLTARDGEQLYYDSVGHSNPSLADILKMTHPKPTTKVQNAVFGYILGKEYDAKHLPKTVKQLEKFKKDNTETLPDVPFRVLTNYNLTSEHWKQLAENMKWNTLRMNLNMLERNGVFQDSSLTKKLAGMIGDRTQVKKNNVFPYQLMTTFQNIKGVPQSVANALQDALEYSTENVPELTKRLAVCVDTSGSMASAITGNRGSVTSVTRCVDVAGLIAACLVRKNEETKVVPFDTEVHNVQFNSRDSVMTNAQKFARNGGGTACSVALKSLNQERWSGDLVIYVSDNMSWADYSRPTYNGYTRSYFEGTCMASEWMEFKKRNPRAKLVLIDLQPNQGTQVKDDKDVLNIGGWSDSVFEVIKNFISGDRDHFVEVVKKVEI